MSDTPQGDSFGSWFTELGQLADTGLEVRDRYRRGNANNQNNQAVAVPAASQPDHRAGSLAAPSFADSILEHPERLLMAAVALLVVGIVLKKFL